MKILYAIQGTGNGHLSRARDIIPQLEKHGELDVLVSGIQADISLPYPVKYQLQGLSFMFGKNGGVDLFKTIRNCNFKGLIKEIISLPISEYDLVINDFEPVSSWASFFRNKQCISLSHQAAVLHKNAPLPKERDVIGKFILKFYSPVSAKYGFHFISFGPNTFTPVIRKEIRELPLATKPHYTIYLPSYSDEKIIKFLDNFPEIQWQVFSKRAKNFYINKNISIYPISNELFIESLASCTGVMCGAGFETPAEALFLKKKLMVIPMKNQYEQQCNAAVLKFLGVPVIKKLKKKYILDVEEWLKCDQKIEVNYTDQTEDIINHLISKYAPGKIQLQPFISRRNKWKQKISLLFSGS